MDAERDAQSEGENLGLQLLSFRIQKQIIEQLKQLAKLEGTGYQPLMRRVLTQYVRENEYKLEKLVTPAERVEQADALFTKAIRLRDEISTLAPFSNERVSAEIDYTKALAKAQGLFTQVLQETFEPALQMHAKKRMSQITEICQEEIQSAHDKKYGKK